jgi:hypothetical protein
VSVVEFGNVYFFLIVKIVVISRKRKEILKLVQKLIFSAQELQTLPEIGQKMLLLLFLKVFVCESFFYFVFAVCYRSLLAVPGIQPFIYWNIFLMTLMNMNHSSNVFCAIILFGTYLMIHIENKISSTSTSKTIDKMAALFSEVSQTVNSFVEIFSLLLTIILFQDFIAILSEVGQMYN